MELSVVMAHLCTCTVLNYVSCLPMGSTDVQAAGVINAPIASNPCGVVGGEVVVCK